MSEQEEHGEVSRPQQGEHDPEGHLRHGHAHEGHDDHDHGHGDHDHTLITERLPAGHWRVDPESSEVNFRARALFGLLPVNGFFGGFNGELRVDQQGNTAGSLLLETASLATGIARRDADLRSANYLDAAQYPQITFTLEAVEPSGEDHLNLTGELSIHGTMIPLTFPVHAIQHGDHLHIEGRVRIDHHGAGLGWSKPGMVGKSVRADVALTLNPAA